MSAVEFIEDPKMIRWCPLAAVLLGGQKMESLDLSKPGALQEFGRVLLENECACPRCQEPYRCELEKLRQAGGLVPRIRCTACGFKFSWYAAESSFLVYDSTLGGRREWDPYYPDEGRPEDVQEEDGVPAGLREQLAELRCPICREALLHPIRARPALVRVVCRNAGCRQQWGIPTRELHNCGTEPVLTEAAHG